MHLAIGTPAAARPFNFSDFQPARTCGQGSQDVERNGPPPLPEVKAPEVGRNVDMHGLPILQSAVNRVLNQAPFRTAPFHTFQNQPAGAITRTDFLSLPEHEFGLMNGVRFDRSDMRLNVNPTVPLCKLYGRTFPVHVGSMSTAAALKEYDARVDAKKRVTIRGAEFEYFRVIHRKDGTILLKPRVLADSISARTLQGMDAAAKNLRAGKRSKPVDLKKLAAMKI